jgi:hypothetical protein
MEEHGFTHKCDLKKLKDLWDRSVSPFWHSIPSAHDKSIDEKKFTELATFVHMDAFGKGPLCEKILLGKRNGWNALEEKTMSWEDKKTLPK